MFTKLLSGLRTIVNALLRSLRPLVEVLLIMCFLLIVIALIALQAYQGVLRRRCVLYPGTDDNVTGPNYYTYIQNKSKGTVFFSVTPDWHSRHLLRGVILNVLWKSSSLFFQISNCLKDT